MKKVLFSLIISILLVSCNGTTENRVSKVTNHAKNGFENTNANEIKKITNPLKLVYKYYDQVVADDGSIFNVFTENKQDINRDGSGDYIWVKMVPVDTTSSIKYSFEYQMDLTDEDFNALQNWLIDNMGPNYNIIKDIDYPFWFTYEMSLKDAYEYCKKNYTDITMAYVNESMRYITLVVINTEPLYSNTENEMAIVLRVFN